ncbi:MAG TPA: type I glyceraldehyde-3-phosphate dehydrogenase [Syntrophomonadaceae bacterium]|nr:type I glyceraldehyde-3-phosphate dehydrogenase [Syntrophomonadaceae bacterium]HOQ10451.1 type I glyceraldehyde-3-phosphate dehydrogenase [Syntrophomonadaceae bacterium]HPU49603.1 type I glyceraldehyde-3-phosphate dehydrogenase [Syntrophomonadaceae bacterium]
MAVKIAINGFGRIGRLVGRIAMQRNDVEIAAINDLGSISASAHLFKYDSLHGQYKGTVEEDGKNLIIDGHSIPYLTEKDPESLPWKDLGVQIVVEGTGKFRSQDKAGKHIKAGAKKVIITAPGKDVEFTLVMGVNHQKYRPEYQVISMASCTTNCLAPVAKVLMDEFGIVKGFMNTVHSYTNDQRILDLEHSDLRRARAAAQSMIPTTTGAASAIGLVIPELDGKLDGLAIRVPTPTVSLLDLTVELENPATQEQINAAFFAASKGSLKGVLDYTEVPLVSSDFRGTEYSAIVDGLLTMTIGDRMAKVIAWYDNEWAYATRIVDTVSYIASQGL